MKYLIVGLGNIGPEYENSRHNIGFMMLDAFAKASNVFFEDKRYGYVAETRLKNKSLILLKPSTFMNLSGNAVRYWRNKEKIEIENILVLVDDLALPYGTLRLKSKGSSAGHNGLQNIQETLGTQNYARLRFGIGSDFSRGKQVNYVLSPFLDEEKDQMPPLFEASTDIIRSFCLAGVNVTMNQYNKRK
ncbi:MAG: aminoacyl-tRNA hydrolase [Dysgonamonadaceae bacterium]